jgi:hypothetical protein
MVEPEDGRRLDEPQQQRRRVLEPAITGCGVCLRSVPTRVSPKSTWNAPATSTIANTTAITMRVSPERMNSACEATRLLTMMAPMKKVVMTRGA